LHSVIANNPSVTGCKNDSSLCRSSENFGGVLAHGDIWLELDARFPLHDVNILGNGVREDLLYNTDVLSTSVDYNRDLLNLDKSLNNQLLKKVGVVLTTGNHSAFLSSLSGELVKKTVAKPHLLDAALSNFGRASDTLLNLAVLLLLCKFLLDTKLGLMDEGLLLKIEIMLGLSRFE